MANEKEKENFRKPLLYLSIMVVGIIFMYMLWYYGNLSSITYSVVASADTMKNTLLVVHPGGTLRQEQTVVYSPAFQQALAMQKGTAAPAAFLPEDFHVAMAGRGADHIRDSINFFINKKIGTHPPVEVAVGAEEWAVFSYIFRKLELNEHFFAMPPRQGVPYRTLLYKPSPSGEVEMAMIGEQVFLRISFTGEEELLVGKLPAATTLQQVQAQVENALQYAQAPEQPVALPLLDFMVGQQHHELERPPVKQTNNRIKVMMLPSGRPDTTVVQKALLLKPPLYMALKMKSASEPYLMMWLGNTDLLR